MKTLQNILAVISGIVVAGLVNMGIVMISGLIIPPPNGIDMTTAEGINQALPLMEPKHFLMPFLAHALGTLFGAFLTAGIAVSRHLRLSMIIGIFYLVGGVLMFKEISSPLWFMVVDLALAYLPMAWLGYRWAPKKVRA